MASLLNREYLSGVDAAWLRMEDPTNLMMITGLFLLDAPADFDRFLDVLETRMLKFQRFKQRVRKPPVGPPYWEDDPLFDLRNHVRRVALPGEGGDEELHALVSDLMSEGLDFSRPLWQLHVVDNYQGGGAIISRLHHSIGDGIALMYVLLAMTDFTAEGLRPDMEQEQRAQRSNNPVEMIFRRASGVMEVAATAREMTEKALREGMSSVMDPAEAFDLVLQGTGVAATSAISLAKIALRPPDPKTMFKGKLGVRKRAAWTTPIPLADIKAIGKVTGGTVNDVLLTAMAGALRRYMEKQGERTRGLSIRATIPVNLRPLDTMGELGNKFGLVFLSLPIGIVDPVERLRALKRNMDRLKDSPEAVLVFGLLGTFGMGPEEVQELAVRFFASKATAVMTNVPGPRIPLYVAGSEITGLMFWVPQSGKLGLGVSIFSYNGTVRMGIAVDEKMVKDPRAMTDELHVELAEMRKLVTQLEEEAAEATDDQTSAIVVEEITPEPPASEDDLQKIKGIGPKAEAYLYEKGVTSYAQLAAMSHPELEALLNKGGRRFQALDPTTWPEQAASLGA